MDTLVRETIGLQLAVLECADGVLHLLVAAIEGRGVKIR